MTTGELSLITGIRSDLPGEITVKVLGRYDLDDVTGQRLMGRCHQQRCKHCLPKDEHDPELHIASGQMLNVTLYNYILSMDTPVNQVGRDGAAGRGSLDFRAWPKNTRMRGIITSGLMT